VRRASSSDARLPPGVVVGALFFLPACTCARSFVVPPDAAVDAALGSDGATGADAGHLPDPGPPPRDAGAEGDAFEGDAGDCSEVAGYRRCDTCALRCERGTVCSRRLGLCITREPDGSNEACWIVLGDRQHPSGGCPAAEPCAVGHGPGAGSGTPEDPYHGLCVGPDRPEQFCRRGTEAGQFVCYYDNGSRYVHGPPTEPACTSLTPSTASCGGVCPEVECPDLELDPEGSSWLLVAAGGCVGLSELRSFGLCTYSSGGPSCLGYASRLEGAYLAACVRQFGEPCACMQMLDAHVQPWTDMVEAEACRRYARLFPESIRCLRSDGTPL
jgi:hypothetical protein